MTATRDRLLWIPKGSIAPDVLDDALTVYPKTHDGSEPEAVTLWESGRGVYGVPRAWAGGFGRAVVENTVFPASDWPEIAFPAGGGYWPGQEKTVSDTCRALLAHGDARLEAPCGDGKTLMGLSIGSRIGTPTLIVVHKTDLSDQWHETARDFFPGISCGHVQASKWDWQGHNVVTATAQTLYRRRGEILKDRTDFLTNFGMVIFDEGHHYPARTFEKVLGLFPSRHRLGVSATWRRRDGMESVWKLHLGDAVVQHRGKRRTGGVFYQLPRKTSLNDSLFNKSNHGFLITMIARSAEYNKWLASQVVQALAAGRRVLLVGDRTKQLEAIRKVMTERGEDVGIYVSKTKDKDAAKKKAAIFATYGMMNEGTDVPALDTLIFGTPRSDVEQVVGRIQRDHEGKRQLLIVDPVHSLAITRGMAKKRRKIYAKLGFEDARNDA